jgi:hypothetical protein
MPEKHWESAANRKVKKSVTTGSFTPADEAHDDGLRVVCSGIYESQIRDMA